MASKAECDQFAVDFMHRFDELTQWAIEHWPRKDFPLLESDFSASRREIGEILGPKLGDGDDDEHGLPSPAKDAGQQGQYIDMNPMPWP